MTEGTQRWRVRERETTSSSQTDKNNEGDGGINSWPHCSRKIRLLAQSPMQSGHGRLDGWVGSGRRINAVQESRAAPISSYGSLAPAVLSALANSRHGYLHSASLVPQGLPEPPLWPLLGRTARWLASDKALVLVLLPDPPIIPALV